MSFDIRPLFYPSYWLTLEPPRVWDGSGRSLAIIFIGMLIASVVIRRFKLPKAADKIQANLYRRIANMLVTLGLVGMALYFLSYEQIRLLGARPLYLVWLAGLAAWVAFLVRFARKEAPAVRQGELDRRAIQKYLPKRRK